MNFYRLVKKIGTHATKVAKRMSNNNSQKLLDSAKNTTIDAIKNASKREATGDLTGNKIAHKITVIQNLHKMLQNNCIQKQVKMKYKYQKKDISLQKKNKKLLMN